MKAASLLLASFCFLSTAFAHIAISFPPSQGGPWSKDPVKEVHAWIGYKGKKFPCGGYKQGPVTDFDAGDIVKVRFWNHQVGEEDKFPRRGGLSQSRHGGGACEFSLSYDKGKTWKVIGQYTKTCPDIYYEWPVQIPPNVPSCTDPDKCLFAMSWVAYATNQYYHHCSNVRIKGKEGGRLPELDMTIVDVKQLGQKMNVHAEGDKKRGKSSGPDARERRQNTNGFYAYGGGAGKKGINLGLIRS